MKHFALVSALDPKRARALTGVALAFASDERWPRATTLAIAGDRPSELVVWGSDDMDVINSERQQVACLFIRGAYDEDGVRLTSGIVLDRVATSGTSSLARIAAPQSVVLAFGQPVRVIAATDRIGLSSVYYASIGDTVAIGSSSRLVAAILGRELDEDALAAYAVLGAYAANDTPYRGVRRLGAGEYVRVNGRGLAVEQYSSTAAPNRAGGDMSCAVSAGVAAVRTGVESCAAAYPEATIELSGGLDSRLILAALLARGYKPIQALTLGEANSPDVSIAAALARRAGIEHRRVDLAGVARLAPQEALAIVDAAGRRRDYSDNCVSLGVLDWVERTFGVAPRFSGQNGELARGFYYPLQPTWPTTADVLSRALVRWRLIANERVSSELLEVGARTAGERHAMTTTQSFLARTGCDWLTATDLLYVYWRMQRWVGSDWSASAQSRVVLAPLFSSAFVGWALTAPPRLKRGSRLLARVLHEIDPELARLPSANGRSPAAMFEPTVKARVSGTPYIARKVAVKLRQRLKDSTKPPVGADGLSRLVLEAMRDEQAGLERVAALPFVSTEYVERLAGGAPASPSTVGLLVALSGLTTDGAQRTHRLASARSHGNLEASPL